MFLEKIVAISMTFRWNRLFIIGLIAILSAECIQGFCVSHQMISPCKSCTPLFMSDEIDGTTTKKKKSLEEKMASWEATDEEIKAASLGGITPRRADGFDVGLYIAFPIIVLSSLAFAFFPFIMDKIDVTSVGPPPTM